MKVLAFSIGFGRELFGFDDRHGTRWKFCLIPLGGYVRMLGDADETSAKADTAKLSEAERRHAFPTQPVGSRMAIAAAGPVANCIFALLAYAAGFMTGGQQTTVPTVGRVMPGSAAEDAGLLPGDTFLSIDGTRITRFEQVRQLTQLALDRPMRVVVSRGGRDVAIAVRPRVIERTDRFGTVERTPVMGVVSSGQTVMARQGPVTATVSALRVTTESSRIIRRDLQMIRGVRPPTSWAGRSASEVIRRQGAEAGCAADRDDAVSVGQLGFDHLLPIPLLDGGICCFMRSRRCACVRCPRGAGRRPEDRRRSGRRVDDFRDVERHFASCLSLAVVMRRAGADGGHCVELGGGKPCALGL